MPDSPVASFREGGVNDRNPSRFPVYAGGVVVRGSKPDPPDERVLELFGGVNVRSLPRFSFGVKAPELPTFLPTGGFASRPPWNVPAFGFVPAVGVPRPKPASPPLMRPPAEIAETWFCCMAWRRPAVCCWNDSGWATLLCTDPKKRSEPPLRTVDGAAARPLADRLARDGTTGRFPAIMRAPFNCS